MNEELNYCSECGVEVPFEQEFCIQCEELYANESL